MFATTALLTTTGFTDLGAATTVVLENPAASGAVRALTSPGDHADAAIPGDFDALMGYTPHRIDGMLADPEGNCSSPVPLPAEFDTACKAHDLGYDLLRYAARKGEELGPWARVSLDAQLDRRMHTACVGRPEVQSRTWCNLAATAATSAVAGNSWRQGYSTPVTEPGLHCLLAGGIGFALLAGLARMVRRRGYSAGAAA